MSEYRGETNGQLLEEVINLVAGLADCNRANVAAYREWIEANGEAK